MPSLWDKSLVNGLVTSRSVLFTDVSHHTFVGSVDFSDGPKPLPTLDPAFWYVLRMYRSLEPRVQECVAEVEFPNTVGVATVSWTGIARRLYLTLETSRIVPAELLLSY